MKNKHKLIKAIPVVALLVGLLFQNITEKVKANIQPTVSGGPQTIELNTHPFDCVKGLTATDSEGQDITSNIRATSCDVNPDKTGDYPVVYSVADAKGNSLEWTIVHKVVDYRPTLTGSAQTVLSGSPLDLLKGIKATSHTLKDLISEVKTNPEAKDIDTSTPAKIPVTYTVTDEEGRSKTLVLTHTILDSSPTITVGDNYQYEYFQGTKENSPKNSDLLKGIVVTNALGEIIPSEDIVITGSVDISVVGDQKVTFTVDLGNGKPVSKEIVYSVKSLPAPVITILKTKTATIGRDVMDYNYRQGVSAIDGTGKDISANITMIGEVDTTKAGSYPIHFSIKDELDQQSLAPFTFVVTDNKPTIVPPKTVASFKVGDVAPTPTDLLSGFVGQDTEDGTLVLSVSGEVDTSKVGEYPVTYTAKDKHNNVTELIVKYNVRGNSVPVLVVPKDQNIEIYTGFDGLAGVSATDEEDGDITKNIVIRVIKGQIDDLGELIYDYIIVDRDGNEVIKRVNFKVVDTTKPTIRSLRSLVIKYGEPFDAKDFFEFADNYDNGHVLKHEGKLDTTQEGKQTVSISVTDTSGNKTVNNFEFIVEEQIDKELPTIVPKKPLEVAFGQEVNLRDFFTLSDNLSAPEDILLVATPELNTEKEGTQSISIQITDKKGNKTTAQFNFTVNAKPDTEAPTINASNATYFIGEKPNYLKGVSAVDAVEGDMAEHIVVETNYNSEAEGTYAVTYTVSDSSGNKATKTVTFTVLKKEDKLPPTLSVLDATYYVGDKPNFLKNIKAIDNTDGNITDRIKVTTNYNPEKAGSYDVTYSVTDAAGNTTTKTVTFTVLRPKDSVAPVLRTQEVHMVQGNASFNPMVGLLSAVDAVDGDVLSKASYTSNINPEVPGEYTITYQVKDSAGNISEATTTVYVHDKEVGVVEGDQSILYVSDKKIIQGSSFNPLDGIAAIDSVDGDVTKNVTVTGDFDIKQIGTYYLTYSVTNSRGMVTEKTVQLSVEPKSVADVDSSPDAIQENPSHVPIDEEQIIDTAVNRTDEVSYITQIGMFSFVELLSLSLLILVLRTKKQLNEH